MIIAKSIFLFNTIKLIGAGYLIYLGYKSLTSKASKTDLLVTGLKKDIAPLSAIKIGFLTNILNPKATLFFLSLFTLIVTPTSPLFIKILMGAEMSIVQFIWFAFVAYFTSHHLIKNRLVNIQHFAEKFIGVVLIGLGIKMAVSNSK